jgi:hypothetical protein
VGSLFRPLGEFTRRVHQPISASSLGEFTRRVHQPISASSLGEFTRRVHSASLLGEFTRRVHQPISASSPTNLGEFTNQSRRARKITRKKNMGARCVIGMRVLIRIPIPALLHIHQGIAQLVIKRVLTVQVVGSSPKFSFLKVLTPIHRWVHLSVYYYTY